MRSLLIVPADQPAALPAALAARPDAIVIDLGDPAKADRAEARRAAVRLLVAAAAAVPRPLLFVRVAALPTGLVDGDLDAILDAAPDGVLAPGIVGARDVEHLGAKLAVREAMLGRSPGSTGIVAVAGDSARGILALARVADAGPRLRALAFDGHALGGAPDAAFVRAARGALVLAAMAAALPAVEFGEHSTVDLARACEASRRDGFSGRLARNPAEVAAIEAAYKK